MLEAFNKLSLSIKTKARTKRETQVKETRVVKTNTSKESAKTERPAIRCYNCNGFGHLSKECRRTRQDWGTCYACGDRGHQIKDCPKRGDTVSTVQAESDEFHKSVTYEIRTTRTVYALCLDTLLDTGSPISFIKERFVRNCDIQNKITKRFCGINGSGLDIIGEIKVNITLDGITKNDLEIFVVPDNTMLIPVILGRKILKIFGLFWQEICKWIT